MYDVWAEHAFDLNTVVPVDPPPIADLAASLTPSSRQLDGWAELDTPLQPASDHSDWVLLDDPFFDPSISGTETQPGPDPYEPALEPPLYVPPTDDATDLGEVVVTGEVGPWWFNGTRPPNVGGGGSAGGASYDQAAMAAFHYNRQWDDCEDRRVDTIAEQINQEIQQKSDHHRVEYGAIIWRDANGDLQRTALLTGDNRSVTGFAQPPNMIGFSDWSQVVAYIHNHPTEVFLDATQTWVRATPESHFDRPSSGDWSTASFYVGFSASPQNMTVYVSYQGQVKEYDWRHNTNESRNPQDQSPGHGTESGDYRPGTSCQ